jgi:hypothetical protein
MNTPHLGPQMILYVVLYLVAMIFFGLDGLRIPEPPRIKWIGWGLFLFLLSMLVHP